MRPRRLLASLPLVAACTLLLLACATTHIDAEWLNSDFPAGRIEGPVLVVGITREQTARHLYEDAMAAELAARGVRATPSYKVMAGPLEHTSSQLLVDAARSAGARQILSSGLIRREAVERALAEPTGWHWDPWYAGWYRTYWPHASAREVQVFERYVASTSLADAATGKVIWSARTSTEATSEVPREIRAFAATIVRALAAKGFV